MFTFRKEERLCNKSSINNLFAKGNSFFIHPVKVLWLEIEHDRKYPVQVLINVPKRNFKKAVERNYIKRIIREAYRKNKHQIYKSLITKNKKLDIALIYTAKEKTDYQILEQKIIQALERLEYEYEKASD